MGEVVIKHKRDETSYEEKLYTASQWQLMWRKFRRHRLGMVGGLLLLLMYLTALFSGFVAPYAVDTRFSEHVNAPPQRIRFFETDGTFHLRPFVYGLKGAIDRETWMRVYEEDTSRIHPIRFFIRGDTYRLAGLIETDIHLFGVEEGVLFLFGTERLGRDLFSRAVIASQVSLSIGLVGVAVAFVLGILLGGISGYYGGATDVAIQRVVEILLAIPMIPFWMALSAALPSHWSSLRVYFGITLILALRNWAYLARVVRGKLLELREEDFVLAARVSGAREGTIITRHLVPSFMSYLIVHLTLAVPTMIIAETALSFLGLGLRPPVVSWGVLLKEAQNVRTVVVHPWLMIPGAFVVITVLAFNFLGDGLRDAADPYR